MARARLRDRHHDNLRQKLQVLKAEQAITAPSNNDESAGTSRENPIQSDKHQDSSGRPGTSKEHTDADEEDDLSET